MNTTFTTLTTLLFLLPIFLLGQEGTHFTITDENGESLPFATVAYFKNGALIGGTISNLEGKVNLNTEEADSFLVSYVGHQQKTFTQEEIRTSETVSLSSSISLLTTVEVVEFRKQIRGCTLRGCILQSTITSEIEHQELEEKDNQVSEITWNSYPNPTSRYVHVENSSGKAYGMIRVINALGSVIMELPYAGNQTVDLINHPQGMYYINHFYQGKNSNIARVIKSDVF